MVFLNNIWFSHCTFTHYRGAQFSTVIDFIPSYYVSVWTITLENLLSEYYNIINIIFYITLEDHILFPKICL